MSKPLLSILIPTVFEREYLCNLLLQKLGSKIINLSGVDKFAVNVIREVDNKEMTIGEKREGLYQKSTGLFSWQIDDDDDIADNAIQLILEAIKSNPDVDCITFEENCMMNGKYYKSNHSLEYPDWYGDGSHLLADGFHYHRTPFYKDVIKTEIAKSVPFQHIRYGEDHLWSIDLKPKLTSEIHLDTEVYYYIYEPKEDFNTRYGLNK